MPRSITHLQTTPIAAAILLGAALAAPTRPQSVEDVLEAHYEAIGGLEAWRNVRSIRGTGTLTLVALGVEGPFTTSLKRPLMRHIEYFLQGMTGVQAFNGEMGWVAGMAALQFSGTPDPMVAGEELTVRLRERADLDGPLVGWEGDGHTVELVAREEVDGTDAFHLKVTLSWGVVDHVYLDAEHYLPFKTVSPRSIGGVEAEITQVLGDHKQVGELLIPFSLQFDSPTGRVVLEYEMIELDVELDDSLFSMPGG